MCCIGTAISTSPKASCVTILVQVGAAGLCNSHSASVFRFGMHKQAKVEAWLDGERLDGEEQVQMRAGGAVDDSSILLAHNLRR